MESYKRVTLRSDPDRYGFAALLAQRLGLRAPKRSYCTWLHGWIWWEAGTPEELGCGGYAKDVRIVCTNEKQRHLLAQHGYRDVVAGGLPFCYVPRVNVERERGSLLVFLPHSLDYYRTSLPVANYLDFLKTIKQDFSRIDVCIYGHDYDEGTQKRQCEERGLNPIRGLYPDDAEALIKLRARLERYEYVTTPALGSHVLYAAFCGCKVSITRPIFSMPDGHFANDAYYQRFPFLERVARTVASEEFIGSNFPWLLVEHPAEATACETWAAKEIGTEFILGERALKRVLGWDVVGSIRGPLIGAKRRALRMVFTR